MPGHDQVDRPLMELQAGELHAVSRRALNAKAGKQAADLDFRAGQRLVKRDAVAGPGPALHGRHHGHLAQTRPAVGTGPPSPGQKSHRHSSVVFASVPDPSTVSSTGRIIPDVQKCRREGTLPASSCNAQHCSRVDDARQFTTRRLLKQEGTRKSQIPSTKFQVNSKHQISNSKRHRHGASVSVIGIWSFGFVWNLGFGIWDFRPGGRGLCPA